jgi:DNA adenine methylase
VSAPTRPVLRYHGGKWRLAPWIIGHFPAHRLYTEAFGGAGSVLLRKPRAPFMEVYNDLDGEIVNLFRVLRDEASSARLCDLLTATPYARAEFVESYSPVADPVEQARRTVVRSFMGFGSDSASGALTGFRANGNRQNGHPARDWANLPPKLGAIIERLRGVVVECRAGADLIRQHDAPTTLHYVDPPYARETRSAHSYRKGKGYRHEMTESDHRALAEVLRSASGMVVLSGYASSLYDEDLYADWDRREKATHADGALARTEVLWLNPACRSALARAGAA